jgi:hypothetical protein
MMKAIHLSGTFILVFLLFISLLPASSFGEILTIKHTAKQTFGGSQSSDDARISMMQLGEPEEIAGAIVFLSSKEGSYIAGRDARDRWRPCPRRTDASEKGIILMQILKFFERSNRYGNQ